MKPERYYTLDIIRGLAALSVFLAHWGGWTSVGEPRDAGARIVALLQSCMQFVWCAGGIHPGVIVFIVLSGFCIHIPLALNPSKRIEPGFWKSYAIRRACRIVPVFWFGIGLGILATALGLYFSLFRPEFDKGVLTTAGVLTSLGGVAEIGRYILPLDTLYPGNNPLNSVGSEIILYLTYPLLLAVHRRLGIAAVLGIGALSYGAIAALRITGVPADILLGTYFEFLLYWIFGAISAECFVRFKTARGGGVGWFVASVCVVIYLVVGHLVKVRGLYVALDPLLAVATAAGLYALTRAESAHPLRLQMARRVLAVVSERSYSLYACHTPVLILTVLAIRVSHHGPAAFLECWLGCLVVILATELTYRLVEYPSHRLAYRFGRRPMSRELPLA